MKRCMGQLFSMYIVPKFWSEIPENLKFFLILETVQKNLVLLKICQLIIHSYVFYVFL